MIGRGAQSPSGFVFSWVSARELEEVQRLLDPPSPPDPVKLARDIARIVAQTDAARPAHGR